MNDHTRPTTAPRTPRVDGVRGVATREPPAHDPRSNVGDRSAAVLLGGAVVAMGLLAGLFYSFDVAVMPGLAAAEDRTFVDAMHQMIELPAFPVTLLAALALTVGALLRVRRSGPSKATAWIAAGLALYLLMVVVSVAVHFPLNDQLMQAGAPARVEDPAAVRADFATPWVAGNVVRTLALTAALGCLVRALFLHGRAGHAPRVPRVGP